MPKITSVEPQKSSKGRSAYGRKNNRYNIFLDGEFAFGADEDLVVDKRLVPGKEFSISDVEQLIHDAEVGKLMEKMYRLFNIRQRSEKEIRDYFKNLSFKRKLKGEELSLNIINVIIKLLKRKEMVNDKEFADSWMQSRLRKYGTLRIKQELYKKGIDREIIEEVISGRDRSYSEPVAQKLLEKKLERWRSLSTLEFKKKAYDYLLRRGFEYELVKNIVENYSKKR